MYRVVLLSCLILSASIYATSPAEAVNAAYADLQKIAEADRPYIRYQSLYAIKERETFMKVFAFQVNSLSRRARLKKPQDLRVSPDLIRIDIRDFRWNSEVYDKLHSIDPYFHDLIKVSQEKYIEEDWPGGIWPENGKHYNKGEFKTKRKVSSTVTQPVVGTAPWLPADKMSYLLEKTQSKAPILRADWFLAQTGINKDRAAGYYSFLELKKREDFQRLTGFDLKEAQRIERETAAIIKKSGIAIRNRQVYRFGAIDSGYWQTRDVFKNQTKERNAIDALNGDFKHDAEEHYGYLPNRLFAYYLSDQKGVQQDTAPDEVGPDTSSTSNDFKIHIFKSCVTCHKEGLRPLKDYGRQQLFKNNNILASYDKEKFERLEQLYLLPLEKWYNRDVKDFTDALAELNGVDWTPTKNAAEYSKFWKTWVDDDVSLEDVAREIGDGQTAKGLALAIQKYATPVNLGGAGKLVPIGLLALTDEKNPDTLLREHLEEHFSLLQKISRGLVNK